MSEKFWLFMLYENYRAYFKIGRRVSYSILFSTIDLLLSAVSNSFT